ncbi:phytoene desaturase family protein [Dyadobacter fanqingshengii]|uniref:NAD(P)/FAD-dependent oxidoreductase n=1 Tax=Dyadobacter fanqingshengii TaxID=2906443 RepID=A0A9X1PBU2_9BACT|nr:NAD(P)/FAD-dependent oxidoreductase [Dyadobacter fanqingshengii]MCF0041657.1 NAD(P)/FAD-dependent oxidoreductase [Dyadobacter fanqingshengii]USJ36627.1 NAD(P)/FAD-dependent oxidoreductase [Dyadobacter fanqingshengii]
MQKEYDFVIVGSGLGGLACANILALEGFSVVVLEKNHQIGGHLQVYSRGKSIFDTGVHYVGSLDEGENLYQFFKYFGILDKLKMKRMDNDKFDVIRFQDGSEYDYAQGFDHFKATLINYFPEEKTAIDTYCAKIQEVCDRFPLYNLRISGENYQMDGDVVGLNAHDFIASITDNERLRNVLAGSNLLYAGVRDKTPFYVHALIMKSYLSGSYKFIDGGSQIAIQMSKAIRVHGGEIYKYKKVVSANYNDEGRITEVVLENGETFKGKQFISNVHPSVTIDIFGADRFLNVYKNRVQGLENSISTFLVHLTFYEKSFKYLNYNIYQHHIEDVWGGIDYDQETWPQTYFICTPYISKTGEYADSMSVMTYMNASETEKWAGTFSTVAEPGTRDAEYEQFKKDKEAKVLGRLEEVFPGISEKVKAIHSATPLTFRDYIGNKDGSLYGVLKNSNSPTRTQINTKTRIPNLHLTGQNISMHGILGVTVSAFVTCFPFVDKDKLIQKVKNA